MIPPAVAMRGVDLSLGRGAARVHILRDVGLTIARGEAVGLVGPSGSGKSSLMMLIGGLERSDAGRSRSTAEDWARSSEDGLAHSARDNVGIVFQNFHLVPTMTALENVALPAEFAGRPDDARPRGRRTERSGSAIGWSIIPANCRAASSSAWRSPARSPAPGADRRRADRQSRRRDRRMIMELLFDLPRQHGGTLVLVTHDSALAARCDRIVRMRSGAIETAPLVSA